LNVILGIFSLVVCGKCHKIGATHGWAPLTII